MLLKNSLHIVVIVLVGTMRCDRLKAWRYHSVIWHISRTGNCLELLVITDRHAAISHVITLNSGLCFLFTWNCLKLTRNCLQASSPAQLFPFHDNWDLFINLWSHFSKQQIKTRPQETRWREWNKWIPVYGYYFSINVILTKSTLAVCLTIHLHGVWRPNKPVMFILYKKLTILLPVLIVGVKILY